MPKRQTHRGRTACLAVLSSLALLACWEGSTPDPGRQVWIGEVEATDAVIGLAVRGDRVSAYVCGGPETYATHTVWFYTHLAAAETGPFEMERGGWRISVELNGEWAHGTLRHEDEAPLSWTARRPASGSRSDIYAARGDDCRHGAILLPDGESGSVRLQGTWCDGPGQLEQVTPVRPVVGDEGLEIVIAPQGVTSRVVLEPVLK